MYLLCGTSAGVAFGRDIDSITSDYFKRMRVEVKLKVISRSFAIIHIGHEKAALALFSKLR